MRIRKLGLLLLSMLSIGAVASCGGGINDGGNQQQAGATDASSMIAIG